MATDNELDAMSTEELDKHEKEVNEEKEETSSEEEETLQSELDLDESSAKEETDQDKEDESPEKIGDERFKDKSKEDVEEAYFKAEQGYGKQAQELGELRRDNVDLLERLEAIEKAQKPPEEIVQEVFDPEKYGNLLVDSPGEAAEYYHKYFTVPRIETMEREKQAGIEKENNEKQVKDDVDNSIKAFNKFSKLEEYKDIAATDEEAFKFGAYVRQTFLMPKGGYTVDLIKQAHNLYNPDVMKSQIKRDLLQKIEEAAPEVNTISAASGAKTKSSSMPKTGDVEDHAEWAEKNMSMEEMDKALDEAE